MLWTWKIQTFRSSCPAWRIPLFCSKCYLVAVIWGPPRKSHLRCSMGYWLSTVDDKQLGSPVRAFHLSMRFAGCVIPVCVSFPRGFLRHKWDKVRSSLPLTLVVTHLASGFVKSHPQDVPCATPPRQSPALQAQKTNSPRGSRSPWGWGHFDPPQFPVGCNVQWTPVSNLPAQPSYAGVLGGFIRSDFQNNLCTRLDEYASAEVSFDTLGIYEEARLWWSKEALLQEVVGECSGRSLTNSIGHSRLAGARGYRWPSAYRHSNLSHGPWKSLYCPCFTMPPHADRNNGTAQDKKGGKRQHSGGRASAIPFLPKAAPSLVLPAFQVAPLPFHGELATSIRITRTYTCATPCHPLAGPHSNARQGISTCPGVARQPHPAIRTRRSPPRTHTLFFPHQQAGRPEAHRLNPLLRR